MSISLPNGTLLAAPASQVQYTAAVTRILHLTNFSKDLKTKDLQLMFKDFEGEKGGFRIKWVDDINALVVFADAGIAKRAYLSFLLRPPPSFTSPAQIKPYDKADAGQIIATVSARALGHRASMSSAVTGSGMFGQGANGAAHIDQIGNSGGGGGFHGRASSVSVTNGGHGSGMGSFSFPKTRASISGSNPFSASNSTIGGSGSTHPNVIGGSRHIRTGSASGSTSSSSAFNRPNSGVFNFGSSGPSSSSSAANTTGGSASIPFASRLPTHSESLDSPAIPTASYLARRTTRQNQADLERVTSLSGSSSDNEPVVVMDHAPNNGGNPYIAGIGHGVGGGGGSSGFGGGWGGGAGGGHGGGGGFGQWKMPGTGGSSGMKPRRDSVSAEKAMREVEKALASVEAQ